MRVLIGAMLVLGTTSTAWAQPQSAINFACSAWPNYFPGGSCTVAYWNALPEFMRYDALLSTGNLTPPPAPPATPTPPPPVASSGTCAPVGALAVMRLAVVGDSITSGGASFNPWPAFLPAYRPGLTVDTYAVGGATTAQMLGQLSSALAGPAQSIAIMGGFNDVAGGVPLATTIANLRAMVAQASAANVEPILVGVIPDGAATNLTALRSAIRTLAAEEGVRYVDPWPRLADPANPSRMLSLYVQEGAHPNDRGGRRVAEAVAWALGWMGVGD